MTSIFRRKGRRGYALKYKDGDRWRLKHFKTRTAAQDVADRLNAGGAVHGPLFRDYAVAWIQRAALSLCQSTVENYKTVLDCHVIPAFGHLGIEQIARAAVRDLLAKKLSEGM